MGVIHHLTRQGGRRLEKGQLVKRLSQNHPLKWITKAEKIPLTDLLIFHRTWRVYNCFQEFGNSSTFLSDKIRHVNMGSWHLFGRFFHRNIFIQFLFKIFLPLWSHFEGPEILRARIHFFVMNVLPKSFFDPWEWTFV